MIVVPAVAVNLPVPVAVFPDAGPKKVQVSVQANQANAEGELRLPAVAPAFGPRAEHRRPVDGVAVEEIGKTRRAVSELKHAAATRKQVKKLKKALDQLEVLEVGPDGSEQQSDEKS